MKICVLGAGVVGVSTAFALGRLGHDVSVIDKALDVGMGASFANGAQLSYSHIDPLASPSTLTKLPSYLLGTDPAIQLRMSLRPGYLRWGLSFLRNCTPGRYENNRSQRQSLAEESREAIAIFEGELDQEGFIKTGRGKFILAQSNADYKSMKNRDGFLSQRACLEKEPTLASWKPGFMGGIYSPGDFALDPQIYCQTLKTVSEAKFGVEYYFNEDIEKIETQKGNVSHVITSKNSHQADAVVLCLGNETNSVLGKTGSRNLVYPIQGYSLTLPATTASPSVSVTDLKNKMVFANLGTQMRIAGFVDANQKAKNVDARLEQLFNTARENWPDIAEYDGPAKQWSGFRPMTPSGVPNVGPSKVQGLYLNTGHGSLGYTFAAGSAMKIADLIGHAHKNINTNRGNLNVV